MRRFAPEEVTAERTPHANRASGRNGNAPVRLELRWCVFSRRSIPRAGGAYPSFISLKPVNAANPFRCHLVIRTFFSQNLNFYETKILRKGKSGSNGSWLDRPQSRSFTTKLTRFTILSGTVRLVV